MTVESLNDVRQPLIPTLGGPMQAMPAETKNSGRKPNFYDSVENQRVLRQLEEWLEVEKIRQAPNRYQQAIDADFYDGLQWSDEDAQTLAERGQAPLVYNKIMPAVKWVTGTERRTRFDFKVFPRKQGKVDDAESKTRLLKYLQDVNKSQFARSRAFASAVQVGVGWLECGIRGDPTMELLYDREESWRNVIYDSQSKEVDQSDWRYMFRQRWVDLDIAQAMFPDRAAALKAAAVYSDYADAQDNEEWYLGQILQERSADGSVLNRRTFIDTAASLFNRRARVRMYEGWYRVPTKTFFIHDPGGEHHLKEYNLQNTAHTALLAAGAISLFDRMTMKMWVGIFIRGCLLQNMPTPYRHNDFPFTPIWGNRRGRDNAPYGMVRPMRDPQEDYNKRMSKALYSLSTNRVIMDRGAIEDLDEVREEAARPDSIFAVKQGARFELHNDQDIAEHHLEYANLDEKAIGDQGGVTDDMVGRKTNVISGVALEHRQDSGSVTTTDYFDNLRMAAQMHGQKLLTLIAQYYTEEKTFRVVGGMKGEDYWTVNRVQQDDTGQDYLLNPITDSEADFIVDETDYQVSRRQAMADMLTQLLKDLPPQVAMMLLDDVIELYDIPGVDDIVATIRSITGKPPSGKKLSPQEQAAVEAKQAQQQANASAMQELQLRDLEAKVNLANAKVAQLGAQATKLQAEAQEITSGAASDALKESYESQMVELQTEAASTIEELRKQLDEAEMRALDHTEQAQSKLQTATIAARTAITTTNLNNASKERIAAATQRTLEATQGLKANIQGLQQQLAQLAGSHGQMLSGLAKTKLDKPGANKLGDADPFSKIDSRLSSVEQTSQNTAQTAAQLGEGKLDKPKPADTPPADPIGALNKRQDQLEAKHAKLAEGVKKVAKDAKAKGVKRPTSRK